MWDGQNIVAEVGATGVVNTRYLRGINLVAREIDGALQYYQFDAHGDTVHRIDASGNILKTYIYDVFGVEQDAEPLDTNPFRYCGEYFDRETETYYLRARYYNPATGRFGAEDALKDTGDVLGLNLYVYCKNNPTLFVDPTGNISQPSGGKPYLSPQENIGKQYPGRFKAPELGAWNATTAKAGANSFKKDIAKGVSYGLKGLWNSFLALSDSAYIKGGIGTGFGGNIVSSKNFSISLYDKADIWAFNWDSTGFHKSAVKEASAGGELFNLINFGQSGYSYEKQGWVDVGLTDVAPWMQGEGWKDVSSKQIDNNFAFGGSAYWGFGGSFEFGFDLNRLVSGIASAWG